MAAALLACMSSAASAGDKVALTGLSDVSFGTISTFNDLSISQSVCAFSQTLTNGYSVLATGSGTGGSFVLSSGSAGLAYDVLWSASPAQRSGVALTAGVPKSGFTSSAAQKTCNSGPSASATVTLVLRGSALSAAQAGSYAGTLQLTISPE